MAEATGPLKLVVIGATGGVGMEICKQALAQGHHVTAYVRSPERLTLENPNLVKVKGELSDTAAMEEAVKGKDAVLCALGGNALLSRGDICLRGTTAIIEAMDKAGVKRLVVCTSYGCGQGNRTLLPWFVQMLLRHELADKDDQEAEVIKSDLDYTIVRPPRLGDWPAKGDLVVQEEGKLPPNNGIARADVAAFMLQTVVEKSWIKKIMHISWKA